MDASNKDDYNALEKWVQLVGAQFQQDGYLNERTLYQAVLNMRSLYKEIKGEHRWQRGIQKFRKIGRQ